MLVSMGPGHPACHGVGRLILQLSGERIRKLDPHIGLLHRGTETLIKSKHFIKGLPYFDRLDYVSMLTQEHAYCLAIEQLLGYTSLPRELNLLRVLLDELTRILNHLLAIACHALDVGSMSSIFWAFEQREKILEFYERASGARFHAAFHKPAHQFVYQLNKSFFDDLASFTQSCFFTLNEMHLVLTYNSIWKNRLLNIGLLSYEDCYKYSLTGVMARGSGIKHDVRLVQTNTYADYKNIPLKSFYGVNGDCYDRFLIRMLEMGESLRIMSFCLKRLQPNQKTSIYSPLVFKKNTESTKSYTSMQDLINHFIEWHTGFQVKQNHTLSLIESPKGAYAVSLISDGSAKPYKCKIRSPSYYNLQVLPKIARGHYMADLAALMGTIDIVFGEIDR